jgi:GxxExxY protein
MVKKRRSFLRAFVPLWLKYFVMAFRDLKPIEEEIGKAVVNAAFKIHYQLGPGLLEKVYEVCMTHELRKAGYDVSRQLDIPICYDGIQFDEGLRLDLLVSGLVIAELKAIDLVNPVWEAQVISHLKLTNLKLGYLINFNVPLIKDGIKRFRN